MTVRDSITRTRARTPGVEDDPTSTTVRDRALGPTQCGISDAATKCTKGGRKPNICRCMQGAVLSWRCLGRHRPRCQPCSRIGENPPYGMIEGIEETSASSKPDPRLDPTRLGGRPVTGLPTATGHCERNHHVDLMGLLVLGNAPAACAFNRYCSRDREPYVSIRIGDQIPAFHKFVQVL
jgi:hypothetical protein